MRIVSRLKKRKRKGIFYLEMLVLLILLGAVGVVTADLVSLVIRAQRNASKTDVRIHQIDNAMDQLRRDVWSATSMTAKGNHLEVHGPQGTIFWDQVDKPSEGHGMRRTETGIAIAMRSWTEVPEFQFSVEGALLKMEVGPADKADRATLISEALLAGGGQ